MVRPVLLLGLIVFGMAIGWLAQLIVGGGKAVDWGQAIVAGFVGSFVGGLLISLLAGDGLSLRPSGIIGSIVGAIIVVLDLERHPPVPGQPGEREGPVVVEGRAAGRCAVGSSPRRPPTRSPPTSAPTTVGVAAGAELQRGAHQRHLRRDRDADGERRLEAFHWGLVPVWAKDIKIGAQDDQRPGRDASPRAAPSSGRSSTHRCIIPVDGFYEWQKRPGQKRKQPYFIHRLDGEPLAFAGLWETWRDKAGRPRRALAALVHHHHHDAPTRRWRRSTTACR